MNKVLMVSLGCAKNLVNSEQMLYLLKQAGYEIVNEPGEADVAVVNTCGFIDSAVSEAIDKILELVDYKRYAGLKSIVVTGCMTERFREQVLNEMPEIDGILGTGRYSDIVQAVEESLAGEKPEKFGNIDAPVDEVERIVSTPTHYAYIKIAEGCDNRCSYCVIPSLRGKFRSRPMENILREAEELAKSGVKELIVVAQDITRYGTDIDGRRHLAELTRRICRIDGIRWVRLHYLYPDEITDELIETIRDEEKVVKYLDIPIQHINDGILKAMNRRGSGAEIRALFKKLKAEIPSLVLRTSLICGLPGEGEAEFEELCDFLREERLPRVGAFSFSPQEGTPAASMPGQADSDTVKKRVQLIIDLQSDIMDEYNESWLGRETEVICDGTDPETGMYVGRTYADSPDIDGRVYFTAQESVSPGDMLMVKIEDVMDGDLTGRAVL